MRKIDLILAQQNIERRQRRLRRLGVGLLALLVLVMTAVSLLLPAFTLQKEAFCGEEEHTHTKECYERTAICGFEESDAHEHGDACYESVPVLVCGLETDEGHTHTEACLESVVALSCGLEEDAGHMHTDACWLVETVLVCGEEDNPEHEHDESCYQEQRELICDEQERAGHVHNESCYTLKEILICGEQERPAHTHSEACYENRPVLTCERGETEGHTHTDACYEIRLKCDKPEHKHTLACYANPEADLENEYTWTMSLPVFEEGTPRVYRLLGIARSQLGYHESAANFVLDENESVYGYTRYGAWYGYPYGDWCAMFISFCLHYAGIGEDVFPYACSTDEWIAQLNDYGLYYPAGSGYTPRAGDLVFFAAQNGGYSGHVGLVSAVDESNGGFGTIEGNLGDAVARGEYAFGDGRILGYGVLPEALRQEASEYEQRETLRAAIEDAKALEEASKARELEQTEELQSFSGAILSTAYASSETTQSESVKPDANEGEIHLVDAVSSESGAELNETKLQQAKRASGTTTLLGDAPSENINLLDIVDEVGGHKLHATQVRYKDVERGGSIDLSFKYIITKSDNVENAKSHANWTYDLTDWLKENTAIKSIANVSNGVVWSGDNQVGTFKIKDGFVTITPDPKYLEGKNNLEGTFSFSANLDSEETKDKAKLEIEFPGNVTINVDYKKNELNESKTVGATEGNAWQKNGTVEIIEDGGEYYLYYCIAMSPSAKLTTLKLTDTLGEGQTLDKDSVKLKAGDETYTDSAIKDMLTYPVEGNTQKFTLDLAKLSMNTGGIAPVQYILTYRAKLAKDENGKPILTAKTNTAEFDYEGFHDEDTTNVTPNFKEELYTSKSVHGIGNTYVSGGNVSVEKDTNDDYYLYYRLTAKPTTAVDTLTITDTLGAGQNYDAGTADLTLTIGGETVNGFTFDQNTADGSTVLTGTITGGIPANTECVITYRVKLTGEAPLDGTKTNTASWDWNGEPKENTTTVTTEEAAPLIAVKKVADIANAEPGSTITYTITIGDGNQDHSGMTFTDRIANYDFTLVSNIELKDNIGNVVSDATISDPKTAPTGTATGAEYDYFTVKFPDEGPFTGPYTLTYTIKLSEDASLTGTKALTNKGVIGRGESTTTTNVDYGKPTVEKKWSAFDRDNNEVEWIITVTVPKGKILSDVVLEEQNFAGGTGIHYQGESMTIDWVRTIATNIANEVYVSHVEGTNNLTFNGSIGSENEDMTYTVTVYTNLPEGRTFAELEDYYFYNEVMLKVNGDNVGSSYDKKRYEKADFGFIKTGEFDRNNSNEAVWTVIINPEHHTIYPDIIPYFQDTIPDGMEFAGDSIHVAVSGDGNLNKNGFAIWDMENNYPYSTNSNQINSINLVKAVLGSTDEKYGPEGLSGMAYTVTYRTKLTEEMQKKIQENVGIYTFTNKARIVDEDGMTLKSTSETIKYTYEGLVEKKDISETDASNKISELKYEIDVNPEAKTLNGGKPLELYDILKTDVTLERNSVVIYKVTDSEPERKQVYGADTAQADKDPSISAGYDDNTRKLLFLLPDQTHYIVTFKAKPNKSSGKFENTVTLRAGNLYVESKTDKTHDVAASATLTGDNNNTITLLKLDSADLTQALSGAKFELHKLTLGSDYSITHDGDERILASEEGGLYTTDVNGTTKFANLEEGVLYYWKEIEAPEGYMLTDNNPHYFVIYNVYDATNFVSSLTTYSLSRITELVDSKNQVVFTQAGANTLKNKIKEALNLGEDGDDFDLSILKSHTDLFQQLIDYENLRSNTEAKKIDNRAQTANQITVATLPANSTWNWRNAKLGANAVLHGTKELIGRNLAVNEFTFNLYEVNGSSELWLQTVKNEEDGTFSFSPIVYRQAGTYHYRIREGIPGRDDDVTNDPDILYDDSTYEVTVEVREEDLHKNGANVENWRIPAEQITYTKNGEKVSGGAKFFNQKDEASIILTKTFSGTYELTDAQKKRITFRVMKEDGWIVKEINYSDFIAGRYTLTDGIEPDTTYKIEELHADIAGVVRVTTYTVDSRTQQGDTATASTEGNKAAVVAFDNRYDEKTMTIPVLKRFYTNVKGATAPNNVKEVTAPGNVNEVYFKLQRYNDNAAEGTDPWQFLNRSYEVENPEFTENTDHSKTDISDRTYQFDNYFAISALNGWGMELEDLPLGRYRIMEIEPKVNATGNRTGWKIVNHGNVIYTDAPLTSSTTVPTSYGEELGFDLEKLDAAAKPKYYIYNRAYDVTFIKSWKNTDGTAVANPYDLGVKSVTLQLQSTTCLNPNANAPEQQFKEPWQTLEGKTVTLTFEEGETAPTEAVFTDVPRKNADGLNLYYRVVETSMTLTDGTVLNESQIAERFKLSFTAIGKKTKEKDDKGKNIPSTTDFNAYMKPGDGDTFSTQEITNIAQPIGISVTKKWNRTGDHVNPQPVYFYMEADYWGAMNKVTDYPDDTGNAPSNGVYKIDYKDGKYVPVTFTYLLRKSNQMLLDTPYYNYTNITKVRFVECNEYGNAISDNVLATYTFTEDGVEKIVDKDGIDPTATGVYTITNSDRKDTKLQVTKSWTGEDAGGEIRYKLHLVDKDGNDEILIKDRSTTDENTTDKVLVGNATWTNEADWYCDTLKLIKDSNTGGEWQTTTFTIPWNYSTKNQWYYTAGNYPSYIYVEEVDPNDPENPDKWHVAYTFKADATDEAETEPIAAGGNTKPIIAGESGTLTIVNAPTSTVMDVTVKKTWQKDGKTVTWPGSVSWVSVQLWRRVNSGEPEMVPESTVRLTSSSPEYTWTGLPKKDSAGNDYTYFVREEFVRARDSSGNMVIDDPANWFVGTSARASDEGEWKSMKVVKAEPDVTNESKATAALTNTAKDEPLVALTLTKRWLDQDGKAKTLQPGTKITLRLWSQTDYETTPTLVSTTGLPLQNLTLGADNTLILVNTEAGWPTGKITLPKYRNGDLIRYYVEELSAVDKNGNPMLCRVSYYLNNKPVGNAKAAATNNGWIAVENRDTEKFVEVSKVWLNSSGEIDTRSHAAETVTLQLYRWTDSTSPEAPATDIPVSPSAIETWSGAEVAQDKAGHEIPPVTLNTDELDWHYRWDNLPEYTATDPAVKYHYGVLETKVESTAASSNTASYRYYYTDGTSSNDFEPQKDVLRVEVRNKPEYGSSQTEASLRIVKVDALNRDKHLTGAVFQIEKENGNIWEVFKGDNETGQYAVNNESGVMVNKLTSGNYRVREIQAPAGYLILNNGFTFRIGERGEISSAGDILVTYEAGVLSVGNQPGVQLPSTGGLGAESFRLGGALLLLAALETGIPALRKTKKEEDEA